MARSLMCENGGNSNFSARDAARRDVGDGSMTGESQTGAYVGMMHTF